jgi:hypothetical protein
MASSASSPLPAELVSLLDALNDQVKRLADAAYAVTATNVTPAPEKQQGLGAAFSELRAGLASVTGAILGVVAATQGWVAALQPGLIQLFNLSIRNLQATIGVAFGGIFEQGIGFLKELAAEVQPVFAQLKPIVDELAKTVLKGLSVALLALVPSLQLALPFLKTFSLILESLVAIIQPFVSIVGILVTAYLAPLTLALAALNALLGPFIQLFAVASDGLTATFQELQVIFSVLIESVAAWMTALLGTDVSDAIKSVKDAFRELQKQIVQTVVYLALLVGATDFVRRLRDAFSKQGEQAVGQTGIKSLEQIGKDLAAASVNAAGASESKDATNKNIVEAIDKAREDAKSNTGVLVNAIMTIQRYGSAVSTVAGNFLDDPLGWTSNNVKKDLGITTWNPFG